MRKSECLEIPRIVAAIRPNRRGKKFNSVQSRFFDRIAFGLSDCWYWSGTIDELGYGVVRHRGTHLGEIKAHRFAFRLFNGDIPEDMKVCHRCDIRNCVNPEHLFLGTQQENVSDMIAKGRKANCVPHGEQHGNAKLNDEMVRQMRIASQSGTESITDIASRFGVNMTTAYMAIKGKTWRHVQ